MFFRTALLFNIVVGGVLLSTGVNADMGDCMEQDLGGRIYNVCKADDGELRCLICTSRGRDCTEVPCPSDAH